jgi:hypothetical protein
LEYAYLAYQHQPPESAKAIDEITQAYVSWRYGKQNPNVNQLRLRLRELKKSQLKKRWQQRQDLRLKTQ